MTAGRPAESDRGADLREAMRRFASGVTIVSTEAPTGELYGLTASSFTSVSLDPPLILACVGEGSRTLTAIRAAGTFAVTLLAREQRDLALRFAAAGDRGWEELEFERAADGGAPVFHRGLTSIECAVHRIDEGGDHAIVIGRVQRVSHHRGEAEPLIFFRSSLAGFGRDEESDSAPGLHTGCVLGEVLGETWCSCPGDSGTSFEFTASRKVALDGPR